MEKQRVIFCRLLRLFSFHFGKAFSSIGCKQGNLHSFYINNKTNVKMKLALLTIDQRMEMQMDNSYIKKIVSITNHQEMQIKTTMRIPHFSKNTYY
jgi:hypothetical protein